MRVVQFFRKQLGKNITQNLCLGLQLPPSCDGNKVDTGDVVELPKSYLGLSEDHTSIDLITKWDQVQGQLQR